MSWDSHQTTNVFSKLYQSRKRFTFSQGGTRSSKTYSMIQLIVLTALKYQNKKLTFSVCSESLPHLKKGAMKDFFDYIEKIGLYSERNHNKTDNKYFIGKFTIEFFGVDSSGKVHGASRDFLFVNEIQNIKFETFFQLVQRTNIRVYADYNPTHDFWVFENFLNDQSYDDDICFIKSNIFDNKFISEAIKKDVLRRAAKDENYKKVYLDGEVGTLEGLIYPKFNIISEIPPGIDNNFGGLDFGFTNHPSTLQNMYATGENLYIDEIFYKTEMENSDIIREIKKAEKTRLEIWADSAEPKSITQIYRAGINIKPVVKGEILFGIGVVKNYNIYVTKRSVNTIKEFRSYRYATDKNGKALNEPLKEDDHAMDAIRYGCIMRLGNIQKEPAKIKKVRLI